jgi:glycosyltransferase involved in cell wall biosynthesis
MADSPAISVVVPTRDRARSLARCLDALEGQSTRDELEVIVVDDGSQRAGEIAALVGRRPGRRLLRESGRGPAAARNAGARAARAPILCFCDDDCEPLPGWAGALVARLRAGADAVAGETVNARPDDALASASQRIASYLTRSSFRAGGAPFAPSNNLACRAEVLAAVPFDERYPSAAGEDRDWCARLATAGFELVLEPAARVEHRQEDDLAGFWRRHADFGRAARRFGAVHADGTLPSPLRFYAGLVRDGFRKGPRVGALVCLAQLATAYGYLSGALPRGGDRSAPDG